MKRLEVRCCCQPEKLLGHVDVPDHMALPGKTLVAVRRELPPPVWQQSEGDRMAAVRVNQVVFPIELYQVYGRTGLISYPAVKAEGYESTVLETLLARWNFRPALRLAVQDVTT